MKNYQSLILRLFGKCNKVLIISNLRRSKNSIRAWTRYGLAVILFLKI